MARPSQGLGSGCYRLRFASVLRTAPSGRAFRIPRANDRAPIQVVILKEAFRSEQIINPVLFQGYSVVRILLFDP
jgi:hypothetical protein